MSAFLCSYETLAKAASAGPEHLHGQSFHELMLLNADGYGQRYAHIEGIEDEVTAWCQGTATFMPAYCSDLLTSWYALRCVLYQSSEGDVPESESYKKWDKISDERAHTFASNAAMDAGLEWGA